MNTTIRQLIRRVLANLRRWDFAKLFAEEREENRRERREINARVGEFENRMQTQEAWRNRTQPAIQRWENAERDALQRERPESALAALAADARNAAAREEARPRRWRLRG